MLTTRSPEDVADQLVDLLTDPSLPAGHATFAGKRGTFPASPYVTDAGRQQDLVAVSEALLARVRNRS